MQYKLFSYIYNFFLELSYQVLHNAYQASKKVRNLQKNYLCYKSDRSYRRSAENAAMYMYTAVNKLESEIYWNLVEFKISRYIIYILTKIYYFFFKKEFQSYNIQKDILSNLNNTSLKKEIIEKKLAWIEAVLLDLQNLKHSSWNEANIFLFRNGIGEKIKTSWLPYLNLKPKNITYDSIGLVPRSIIRTISRFTSELRGESASLVISEFRLAKYQAVASLQYLVCLIFLPWMVSILSKKFIFEPFAENWWNTSHFQIFLGPVQQEKALEELKNIEELIWLNTLMSNDKIVENNRLIFQIHEISIQLANKYNDDSINTVINPFTDLIAIITTGLLLIWGKKRLAILNSWSQEVFHSLSDTMKAFLIVFLADLCIGFHSRHGWEVLTRLFLEHLGFPYSKHLVSCFTSIAPVIFHTLFKYWVFRDLSRISPSIVANYDAMNE